MAAIPTLIDGPHTNYSSYQGRLDDLQIYTGVLSSSDVAYLFANPGSVVADVSGSDFNTALNTSNLPWSTSGDSNWFIETTNTHDGFSAVQSGSVTDQHTSTLSVTVTGPGTLTFYWSSIANDPNGGFDYEFDIDGGYTNDIWGDNVWQQAGPYVIDPGQHVLSWKVGAYGDTDPTQAGFLDQVTFTIGASPAHLINVSRTSTNFQFSFISLSSFSHAVQYRTNLTAGSNWQTYTNVTGDGNLKTIPIPLSVFSPSPQGFVRVLTQ